jgi:prepilin-type processing-associated H-X9-DG protein
MSRAAARSAHPGGVVAAMADGSVRFVGDAIDINVWRAMATRSGDEPIASQQ